MAEKEKPKQKVIMIPASYYKKQKQFSTKSLRDPKTGQMMGREHASESRQDTTGVLRATKYYDRNHNKKMDKGDVYPGEIIGRTTAYPVKGNSNRRASIRRS